MAQLIIQTDEGASIVHELSDGVVTIGRGTDNMVIIANDSVSRCHAEIALSASTAMLRDLHSSNGSVVNGEPITESPLKNGDVIHLGTARSTFVVALAATKLREGVAAEARDDEAEAKAREEAAAEAREAAAAKSREAAAAKARNEAATTARAEAETKAQEETAAKAREEAAAEAREAAEAKARKEEAAAKARREEDAAKALKEETAAKAREVIAARLREEAEATARKNEAAAKTREEAASKVRGQAEAKKREAAADRARKEEAKAKAREYALDDYDGPPTKRRVVIGTAVVLAVVALAAFTFLGSHSKVPGIRQPLIPSVAGDPKLEATKAFWDRIRRIELAGNQTARTFSLGQYPTLSNGMYDFQIINNEDLVGLLDVLTKRARHLSLVSQEFGSLDKLNVDADLAAYANELCAEWDRAAKLDFNAINLVWAVHERRVRFASPGASTLGLFDASAGVKSGQQANLASQEHIAKLTEDWLAQRDQFLVFGTGVEAKGKETNLLLSERYKIEFK